MPVPFPVDLKRAARTDVVVELTRSQVPPRLPFELRGYVSPNTWESRVSTLAGLASQYHRPTFERGYLVVIMMLTFSAPIAVYYVALQALESTTNDVDRRVWLARFTCFAITIAMWIALLVPIIIWKYLGKTRVVRLADQWTREDALSAHSYGGAPVWKARASGLFRDTVVLMVTVPLTKMSNFDRDSHLPPYIAAAGDDVLPPYENLKVTHWSKDLKGGIRYGDLPIYADKLTVV